MQTEAGYHTCAQKRIEIARHMRAICPWVTLINSLGKITSVTTNTLEGLSDVATQWLDDCARSFLTTASSILVFLYDWRVGLILLVGLVLFLLPNTLMRWQGLARFLCDKYQADMDPGSCCFGVQPGIAEVKNYNLVSRSAKSCPRPNEGKSQLDTKMTRPHLVPSGHGDQLTGLFMGLFSIYISMAVWSCW